MILTCATCKTYKTFTHDIHSSFHYVCPKCSTHHVYDEKSALIETKEIKNKTLKNVLQIELGDELKHEGSTFQIISITQRINIDGQWVEYGAYNGKKMLFISSNLKKREDTCILTEYSLPADFDIEVAKKNPIRKNRNRFNYNYLYRAKSISCQGIHLVDPTSEIIYYPFDNEDPESGHFLSFEKVDNEFSAYYGMMVGYQELYRKFKGERYKKIHESNKISKKVLELAALVFIILAVLFTGFNFEGLTKTRIVNFADNQIDHITQSNDYVAKIPLNFRDARETSFNIEGVITSTTHSHVNLKLINIDNHEVVYDQVINLQYNDINKGSSILTKTRKAKPGNYELWVECHSPTASLAVDTYSYVIDVDLKISAGQIVYLTPIVVTLILTVFLFWFILEEEVKYAKPNRNYELRDIIQAKKHMYLIAFIGIVITYICFQSYYNYSTATNNASLEDADYTGRRYHYIYYSSSNHK